MIKRYIKNHEIISFIFLTFLFIVTTTVNTIIITWIFNRTNGSLIFLILFHTCNNMDIDLLVGTYNFAIANIYKFFIVQIIIMIIVVIDMFKHSKFDIIYK